MWNTQRKSACNILAGKLHKKGYLGNQGRDRNTEMV
jgi:hypothetical protein